MRPGGQHKDVCRSGGQGWVSQGSSESCVAFWKDGALEAASTKAASELCKCLGINLCGHSLRIKAGGKKRLRFFLLALLSKQVWQEREQVTLWLRSCFKSQRRQRLGSEDQKAVGLDGWVSLKETSCSPRFVGGCFVHWSLSQYSSAFSSLRGHILRKEVKYTLLIYFWLHRWLSVIEISLSASSTEWIFFSWWLTLRIPKMWTPVKVTRESLWGAAVGRRRARGWFWKCAGSFPGSWGFLPNWRKTHGQTEMVARGTF